MMYPSVLFYRVVHWATNLFLIASAYLAYKVITMDKPLLRAMLFNRPREFLNVIQRFIIVVVLMLVANTAHLLLYHYYVLPDLAMLICDPIWLLLSAVIFILFYRFWNSIKA